MGAILVEEAPPLRNDREVALKGIGDGGRRGLDANIGRRRRPLLPMGDSTNKGQQQDTSHGRYRTHNARASLPQGIAPLRDGSARERSRDREKCVRALH